MPKTEVVHRETWDLDVTPAEGDDWPVVNGWYGGRRRFKPDRVHITVTAGSRGARIVASGLRLKQDGTPGMLRVNEQYYTTSDTMPPWIAELAARTRAQSNLTDEALTREG